MALALFFCFVFFACALLVFSYYHTLGRLPAGRSFCLAKKNQKGALRETEGFS